MSLEDVDPMLVFNKSDRTVLSRRVRRRDKTSVELCRSLTSRRKPRENPAFPNASKAGGLCARRPAPRATVKAAEIPKLPSQEDRCGPPVCFLLCAALSPGSGQGSPGRDATGKFAERGRSFKLAKPSCLSWRCWDLAMKSTRWHGLTPFYDGRRESREAIRPTSSSPPHTIYRRFSLLTHGETDS